MIKKKTRERMSKIIEKIRDGPINNFKMVLGFYIFWLFIKIKTN
jgi:hypothetical protein